MSEITFKLTAATNVGLIRTKNEDNYIVNPDLTQKVWEQTESPDQVYSLGKNGCLLVVADGMGGMNAGEVASEMAVTYVRKAFDAVEDYGPITDCSNHVEEFMKRVIVNADKQIKHRVTEDPSTSGMGTTIVMAWILEKTVHVAWCGDSRAYLFNRTSGLSRLSRDHSYVQELVDSGKLDPELAFDHPNSNIITRSLGDSPVKAQPDYVCKRLSAGDIILLCSDGLCGLCRDEEILSVLMQENSTMADRESNLISAALEAGGHDNVTIAMFDCLTMAEASISSTLAVEAKKPRKEGRRLSGTLKTDDAEDGSAPVPAAPAVSGKGRRHHVGLWILIVLLLLAGGAVLSWYQGWLPESVRQAVEKYLPGAGRDSVPSDETAPVPDEGEDVMTPAALSDELSATDIETSGESPESPVEEEEGTASK